MRNAIARRHSPILGLDERGELASSGGHGTASSNPRTPAAARANNVACAYPVAVRSTVVSRSAASSAVNASGSWKDIVIPRVHAEPDSNRNERGHDIAVSAGQRLGRFRLDAKLGAGGMGQVFRATDLRLGRSVAIKVLSPGTASCRHRLDREACAVAALNHPNVVTVYEIGESDSIPYMATELVEGETLRELTAFGPLPTNRLLDIAVQLADGLAAAHEAGIVHRDLTPTNVMRSRTGVVKILDFGLATVGPPLSGSAGASFAASDASFTLTASGVLPGGVEGTAGYMSPEQARGMVLAFRSDQFAFGAILYELATGRRAFWRPTPVDTLCAVLHEEPEPVDRVQAGVPPPLRWIIERCLSKDPEGRYASTLDLAQELRDLRHSLAPRH